MKIKLNLKCLFSNFVDFFFTPGVHKLIRYSSNWYTYPYLQWDK